MPNTEKLDTAKPKSKKKEWYAIKWQGVQSAENMPVMLRRASASLSFDTSLENAEARIATIMKKKDALYTLVPVDGLIHKIPHARGIKETPEGECVSPISLQSDIDVLIAAGEAIFPKVERQTIFEPGAAMPKFDTSEPVKCFVAVIENSTPVARYPIAVIAAPVEGGVDAIYDYMSSIRSFPDSARIVGDRVSIADVVDSALAKKMKSKDQPVDLMHYFDRSSFGRSIAIKMDDLASAVFIDKDEDFEVQPQGRFKEYRQTLRALGYKRRNAERDPS